MRTLLLALATSATVFVTGVTEVAAGDYRYCIQGEEFAGGAGDFSGSANFCRLNESTIHRECQLLTQSGQAPAAKAFVKPHNKRASVRK